MATEVFIVYAVNADLEDIEPPIHGEVLSAFTTSAGAEADAAQKRAARGAYAAPLKVKRVSVPTVFVHDGSAPGPHLTPMQLVEAIIGVTGSATISIENAIAALTAATAAAAAAGAADLDHARASFIRARVGAGPLKPTPLVEAAVYQIVLEGDIGCGLQRRSGTASDQCEGFSYEVSRLPVER